MYGTKKLRVGALLEMGCPCLNSHIQPIGSAICNLIPNWHIYNHTHFPQEVTVTVLLAKLDG